MDRVPLGCMNTRDKSRVLALQFGGLGDLVLFSELIGSLKTSHPDWIVTLACRAEFAAIAGLFPVAPDQVIGLDLNPYLADYPSDELRRKLENVPQRFQGFQANILIDGSLRPTWLTWFLAALLQPGVSFCCAGAREPKVMLSIIRDWFGLPRGEVIDLGPPPEMHERDRYGLLLDYLEIPRVPAFPWRPPPEWERQARDWLDTHGLPDSGFVACFPGGTPATSVKRWPRANFILTLDSIRSQGFPVLLLGDSEELDELTAIAHTLAGAPAPVFCGDSVSLPLAASVLAKAACYLGNDTGPMHLAQAYGVAGVAIFGGGGQWPRYAPWAAGSVGLVHPLPCFGCDWDCFLGRGLCVDSVSVEAVSMALLSVLKKRTQGPRIVSVRTLDPEIFPLIADASARYRSAQKDRARRLEVIFELANANQRLKASEAQASALRAETDARIGELEMAANQRLALVESIHAEAAARYSIIEELTVAVKERESRIAGLERALALRKRKAQPRQPTGRGG
jgi:ADP-heptose:LPS heptosyltransferase